MRQEEQHTKFKSGKAALRKRYFLKYHMKKNITYVLFTWPKNV